MYDGPLLDVAVQAVDDLLAEGPAKAPNRSCAAGNGSAG